MKNLITMNTLVPLGMVVTLGGGIWWAADQTARTRQNAEDVAVIRQDIRDVKSDVAWLRARAETNKTAAASPNMP